MIRGTKLSVSVVRNRMYLVNSLLALRGLQVRLLIDSTESSIQLTRYVSKVRVGTSIN